MKYKIDLHVHSKFSGDNDSEVEESVLQAIEHNLQGIAFTEHYSYGVSEPVEKLREKYKDKIRIFRGVELSAAEGHCLVFGLDTDPLSLGYAPIDDIVRMVNESGGVVIPSHPFRRGCGLNDKIQDVRGICAVEGYNGCNMYSLNTIAVEMARVLSLPYTGGSDAHAPHEVGLCYTEFDEEVAYDNFVEVLKNGRYRGIDSRKISKGISLFR